MKPHPDRPDDAHEIGEPVKFYLSHRAQIEEWHALRRQAISTCNGVLDDAKGPLSELAADRSLELVDYRRKSLRHLALCSLATARGDQQVPVLSVAIGWNTSNLILDQAGSCPYVSVWLSDHPKREATRARFIEPARPVRASLGAKGTGGWPVWEWVPASEGWWNDPAPYIGLIKSEAERYLDTFFDMICDAVDGALDDDHP